MPDPIMTDFGNASGALQASVAKTPAAEVRQAGSRRRSILERKAQLSRANESARQADESVAEAAMLGGPRLRPDNPPAGTYRLRRKESRRQRATRKNNEERPHSPFEAGHLDITA